MDKPSWYSRASTPARNIPLLHKIRIEVDGVAQTVESGRQEVTMPAGRHDVKVFFKYLTKARTGEAAITVDAPEGSTVSMLYKAPIFMTSRGNLTLIS
jgi:hypothetical protein